MHPNGGWPWDVSTINRSSFSVPSNLQVPQGGPAEGKISPQTRTKVTLASGWKGENKKINTTWFLHESGQRG